MRVTLDTNVLVAAFISRGVCHDLFEYLLRHHTFVCSEYILDEFRSVLITKIRIPKDKADASEQLIRSRAVMVEDAQLDERVSRDPDDDWILAAATNSSSTCLITGDDDLLSLRSFRGVEILRPRDFWEYEIRQTPGDPDETTR